MESKANGVDQAPQQPQPQLPIPSTGCAGPPPYYAAPPVNYAPYPVPMQPMQFAPPPPQQQQQQQTVIVNNAATAPVIVQPAAYDSYCGMQTLGCFVFWCCCLSPFGLVGWILALYADSRKVGDPNGARNFGKASLGVSIAGILVTIIVGGSLIWALQS